MARDRVCDLRSRGRTGGRSDERHPERLSKPPSRGTKRDANRPRPPISPGPTGAEAKAEAGSRAEGECHDNSEHALTGHCGSPDDPPYTCDLKQWRAWQRTARQQRGWHPLPKQRQRGRCSGQRAHRQQRVARSQHRIIRHERHPANRYECRPDAKRDRRGQRHRKRREHWQRRRERRRLRRRLGTATQGGPRGTVRPHPSGLRCCADRGAWVGAWRGREAGGPPKDPVAARARDYRRALPARARRYLNAEVDGHARVRRLAQTLPLLAQNMCDDDRISHRRING
jgi:hypothetical protein